LSTCGSSRASLHVGASRSAHPALLSARTRPHASSRPVFVERSQLRRPGRRRPRPSVAARERAVVDGPLRRDVLSARCRSERRRAPRRAFARCGSPDGPGNRRWRLPCIHQIPLLRFGGVDDAGAHDGPRPAGWRTGGLSRSRQGDLSRNSKRGPGASASPDFDSGERHCSSSSRCESAIGERAGLCSNRESSRCARAMRAQGRCVAELNDLTFGSKRVSRRQSMRRCLRAKVALGSGCTRRRTRLREPVRESERGDSAPRAGIRHHGCRWCLSGISRRAGTAAK
jgi:hypothetical protein